MWLSAVKKLFSSPGSWEKSGCSKAVPKTWLGNKQGGTSLVPMNEKLSGSSWTLARDPVLQTKMLTKSGLENNPKGDPTLQHSSARKRTALLAGFFQKPVNATRSTRRMEKWLHSLLSLHLKPIVSQESEVLQISKTLSREATLWAIPAAFGYHFMEGQKLWVMCFCQSFLLKFEKKLATKRLIQQIFDKLQPNTTEI